MTRSITTYLLGYMRFFLPNFLFWYLFELFVKFILYSYIRTTGPRNGSQFLFYYSYLKAKYISYNIIEEKLSWYLL